MSQVVAELERRLLPRLGEAARPIERDFPMARARPWSAPVGYAGAQAEILEDHGPLGPRGQCFYTVLMKMPWGEEFVIDDPEDEMEPLNLAKGKGEAAP